MALGCFFIGLFNGFSNTKSFQKRRLKFPSRGVGIRSVSVGKHILEATDYVPRTQKNVSVEATGEMASSNFSIHIKSRGKASAKVLRTQIGFLKVHKAASTTIQAIFLRFGWKRNLTFVLPPEFNNFGYPNIISTYDPPNGNNTLPPPENQTFDILCHHVLYNKEAWEEYLPLGYTLIGTVRNPWELFKSMLNYMDPWYISQIKSKDKVRTFLRNPLKFEPNDTQLSMTNNRMSIEFGVDPDIIRTRDFKAFQEFLKKIGKEFDLVIIAEYLDESLILLRRYLNWSIKDILYISKNIRTTKYNTKYIPRKTDFAKFKTFSAFDYLLYDFFKEKLEDQILAEGPLFSSEVTRFQMIKKLVEYFCLRIPESIPFVTITKSDWNAEFRVDREECVLLEKQELNFTQDIRKRQYGSATWTLRDLKKMRRKAKKVEMF